MLTFVSMPLDGDLTITGDVAGDLFASPSGTDWDFIVKLIDVYPENAQPKAWNAEARPKAGEYAHSLNGYELPGAMEVRRGRYLKSYGQPGRWRRTILSNGRFPCRDRNYVFLEGDRLMGSVQSTWFPLIDRNPQTLCPASIRQRRQIT